MSDARVCYISVHSHKCLMPQSCVAAGCVLSRCNRVPVAGAFTREIKDDDATGLGIYTLRLSAAVWKFLQLDMQTNVWNCL